MSLVPTYVKGDDGNWYKDPVLAGKDFFICFDDDDPIELVIKVLNNGSLRTKDQLFKRANEICKDFNAKVTSKTGVYCGRCYVKNTFEDSWCVYIDIKKPIPVKMITEKEKMFTEIPDGEGVFYNFEN